MAHDQEETPQHPRRMVPKWTVRHGRLSVAWSVSAPPAPRPRAAREAMPPADDCRQAAE